MLIMYPFIEYCSLVDFVFTQEVQAVSKQLIGCHAVTDSVCGQQKRQEHRSQKAIKTTCAL